MPWLGSLIYLGIAVSGATSAVEAASIEITSEFILREAYESALQIQSESHRRDTLLFISQAQAEANDLPGALVSISMLPPFSGSGFPSTKEGAIATVVRIRAEVGDVSGALQALTRIKNADSVRNGALADIAAAQARKGEIEDAYQTIAPVRDVSDRAHALNAISVALAQSGDDQGAVQIANSITDAYFRNAALQVVARIQAQRNDISSALNTLTHIPPSHEDERNEVLWSIGIAYAYAGDFEKAMHTVKSLKGDDDALLDIAEIQAQRGQATEARKLAHLVQEPWKQAIGLQGIARALMRAGYKEEAKKTLQLADKTVKREKSHYLKAHARMHCSIARAVLGDVARALRLANTLPNQEEPHDVPKRIKALMEIATVQAAAGDLPGAFQTAEVIYQNILTANLVPRYLPSQIQQSVRRSVWPKILKAAALVGNDREALNRARQITDPEIKAEALLKVAEGLLEKTRTRPSVPSMRHHRFGFPI
ncbi:MAG: hypothetical protein OEY86_18130 [Nitrospira sp.]|nr:hypothetical protein [Nitrospira sp.]